MKKIIASLLCAGTLAAGGVTGGMVYYNSMAQGVEHTGMIAQAETIENTNSNNPLGGIADVAEAVMPAVVSITNKSVQEVQDIFGPYGYYSFYGRGRGRTYQYESTSCGSGIIIGEDDEKGVLYICTNNHVVENATELTVGFVDDEIYAAKIVGTDSSNDLAVVTVALNDISDETRSAIKVAQLGSSDDIRIGEQVIAIGNALGYGQSVTTGIISALNRDLSIIDSAVGLIQTDAAINFGNSGGALLDMNGRVIGINSAKAASSGTEGMGYAIPISYAYPILQDIMENGQQSDSNGSMEKASLGISGKSVTYEVAFLYDLPQGIYLTEIGQGSAAEKAGLQVGDIITGMDGYRLTGTDDLNELMNYYSAGESVEITVARQNQRYQEQTYTVTLDAYEE